MYMAGIDIHIIMKQIAEVVDRLAYQITAVTGMVWYGMVWYGFAPPGRLAHRTLPACEKTNHTPLPFRCYNNILTEIPKDLFANTTQLELL